MRKKFLTANWKDLMMVNWLVDPENLKPWLPAKTELDRWNDQVFVSLVGFQFHNTKLMGWKIPFHINFPEVNLRFYVRYKDNNSWKRGVVFIKEIVPKAAISYAANRFFKEHYITLPMKWFKHVNDGILQVGYHWKYHQQWNRMEVMAETRASALVLGSEEEFITEHFWGYSTVDDSSCNEYQVDHPRWNIHAVTDYTLDGDIMKIYGDKFAQLRATTPHSVYLAEGSAVAVSSARRVRGGGGE